MPAPTESNPFPTVQLRHVLPDRSAHVDWMLGQDGAGKENLVTFRAPRRIDELEPGDSMQIESIGDHRPDYLNYEGPVSERRGEVRRLCSGRISAWDRREQAWSLSISWQQPDGGIHAQQLRVQPEEKSNWTVTCVDSGEEERT